MIQISVSKQKLDKLAQVAERADGVQQQRARAILFAVQGMPSSEISGKVQLTSRQVSYWVRRFERYGLDIFPDAVQEESDDQQKQVERKWHVPLRDAPDVQPDDPMSEAGRKTLAYHFARMVDKESAVRKDEDDEAVHDMRVATRRLRSALDIFGDFYQGHTIKVMGKELRRIGKALGAVRDLEVVKKKADKYAEALSEAEQEALHPLLDDWKSQLDEARAILLDALDSQRYVRFLAKFESFVMTPGQDAATIDAPDPYLVRHVAPSLIYRRYETVRAYEPILDTAPLDTLHALRIDAKRLRYTLEAFEEVLGSEAKEVIETAKAIQDHLGELQDARVAAGLIHDFIQQADEGANSQHMDAALQYLAEREGEKQRLLAGVRENWESFTRTEVRRALGLAVSKL